MFRFSRGLYARDSSTTFFYYRKGVRHYIAMSGWAASCMRKSCYFHALGSDHKITVFSRTYHVFSVDTIWFSLKSEVDRWCSEKKPGCMVWYGDYYCRHTLRTSNVFQMRQHTYLEDHTNQERGVLSVSLRTSKNTSLRTSTHINT